MVKVGVRVSNVVDLRPGGRTAMISLEFDPTLLALAQARACVDEAFRGVVTTGPLATSGGDWASKLLSETSLCLPMGIASRRRPFREAFATRRRYQGL